MDLKIKDVAELLNVSETTIRRWILEGKIPAYRLNHQYRFSLMEIEEWVMRHKLRSTPETHTFSANAKTVLQEKEAPLTKSGNKQFSLYRALHKGNILYNIPGNTKEEVIKAAVKILAKDLNLDADVVKDMLLDREKLMPTALNHGIAVPHSRDLFLNHNDVVSVVFPEKPIPYGALDGQPVNTLFFLFAANDRNHLHLLAKIAHLSQVPGTLQLLVNHPKKQQLLEHVKTWESSISQQMD
jgi:PTS system nitrogen regulatory IIA component